MTLSMRSISSYGSKESHPDLLNYGVDFLYLSKYSSSSSDIDTNTMNIDLGVAEIETEAEHEVLEESHTIVDAVDAVDEVVSDIGVVTSSFYENRIEILRI